MNTSTTAIRLNLELKDKALRMVEPLDMNLTNTVSVFIKAVI